MSARRRLHRWYALAENRQKYRVILTVFVAAAEFGKSRAIRSTLVPDGATSIATLPLAVLGRAFHLAEDDVNV